MAKIIMSQYKALKKLRDKEIIAEFKKFLKGPSFGYGVKSSKIVRLAAKHKITPQTVRNILREAKLIGRDTVPMVAAFPWGWWVFGWMLVILVGAAWYRLNRISKFQKNVKVGDYCIFYIDEDRWKGVIIACSGNNVIIECMGGTYSRTTKDIYPL